MKARLVKVDNDVKILCTDGTISQASPSLMTYFFTRFDEIGIFTGNDGNWSKDYLDMSEYPGETLAYVTDDEKLVVLSSWAAEQAIVPAASDTSKLLTIIEYAKKHNRSKEIIKTFVRNGRISGAVMMGRQWFIPEDAPYPVEEASRKPTSGRTPCSRKAD